TGVPGLDDAELPVDGVAHRDAVPPAAPERETVVERQGIVVGERPLPGRAAVGGAVDPARVRLTDREHLGVGRVGRLHVAEEQTVSPGWADVLPARAAVGGAPDPA